LSKNPNRRRAGCGGSLAWAARRHGLGDAEAAQPRRCGGGGSDLRDAAAGLALEYEKSHGPLLGSLATLPVLHERF
jgi:hypothetical protein